LARHRFAIAAQQDAVPKHRSLPFTAPASRRKRRGLQRRRPAI